MKQKSKQILGWILKAPLIGLGLGALFALAYLLFNSFDSEQIMATALALIVLLAFALGSFLHND